MNKRNLSGDRFEEPKILTEEEQRVLIDNMKKEAQSQTETFRKLFSLLFLVIGAIFVFVGILSVVQPFTLEHQRHFADLVPLEFFLVYYAGSAFCFGVAALVARNPHDTQLKFICNVTAYILGFFMFVTWTKIFYIHGVTNPVLYWIPSVDMAALLLAQYVDFDSKGLVQSVDGLEAYRYDHKSA